MNLKDYLRETGMKKKFLAHKIGVNPITLTSFLTGKRDISLSVGIRIEDVTNGAVTCREIVNPVFVKEYEKKSKRLREQC